MFEILALAVGSGVAKHRLGAWLGVSMPNAIGGELVSALAKKLDGQRQARQAQRHIEAIRDAVIEDLDSFLRSEPGAATSLERVAEALGATLETAPTSERNCCRAAEFQHRSRGNAASNARPAGDGCR